MQMDMIGARVPDLIRYYLGEHAWRSQHAMSARKD